jgi:hypothetical protein
LNGKIYISTTKELTGFIEKQDYALRNVVRRKDMKSEACLIGHA